MDNQVKKSRLDSLDLFRGLTVAGMLIVNNPGTWSKIYPPLEHASWHGCTPTDLIFPFFLFIVGISIKLALDKKLKDSENGIVKGLFRRAFSLYGLGFILASWSIFTRILPAAIFHIQADSWFAVHMSMVPKTMSDFWGALAGVRLTGVLQRIAVCYLTASLVYLHFTKKTDSGIVTDEKSLLKITAGVLVFYYLIMTFIPVPGFGMGQLDSKEANLAAYVDRAVLGNHIWKGGDGKYDPEGVLSTIPAIATTLTGILCGCLLRRKEETEKMLLTVFAYGTGCALIGYLSSALMPMNKALWTSSYVLFTTGLGMILLAFCYWYSDYRSHKTGISPFLYHGTNAITVFFLSGLFAREISLCKIGSGKEAVALQKWFYASFCKLSFLNEYQSSFLYALIFVSFWTILMGVLYRKKIFIKI